MLLAALLLIQWVTLTIGATGPLFPHKEIHLQIPIDSHFSGKDSRINPFINRDSKESSVTGFKYVEQIPSIRKEPRASMSSVNLMTSSENAKPRSGWEVLNFSTEIQPQHRGEHVHDPENMNNSSPQNAKGMDKMIHTPDPGELGELYRGEGEENSTLRSDHHDDHYAKSLEEKVDPFANNSMSNSFAQDSESSFKHEKNNLATLSDKMELEQIPKFKLSNDTSIIKNSNLMDNKSMHMASVNSKHMLSSDILINSTIILNKLKTDEKLLKATSLSDVNAADTNKKSRDSNIELKPQNDENYVTTTSTPVLKVTRKTKTKSRNKNKGGSNSTYSEILISGKGNKLFNSSSPNPMLQDSSYQVVTATTLFSENAWYKNDIDKMHTGRNLNQRSDISDKGTTLVTTISLLFTTPDSHMNDPPFRGPNIPPDEIDHFHKDKEKTKMDYQIPTVVETPTFIIKDLGDDWKPESHILGITWDCHFYVMGSFFAVIALYSFISLLRVHTFITLLNSGYYIAVNSVILLLSLFKSLYLVYDPYNLSGKYPPLAASILSKITLPCLTSSFLLLMLSFLNLTKAQFLSPKFQKPCVIASIITIEFLIFFCSEISVGLFQAPNMITIASYFLLIVCAKLSSISYFYVFRRLHHRALRKQGEMIRLTFTKMHIDGAQLPKKLPKPTLGLSVKLLLISAILLTTLCILIPFGMIFQLILPSVLLNDPWVWWGYHLTCRILELLIVATMSFIATQPQKHFEIGDNRFCSILMWFPCSTFAECFKKEEIIDFEAHSDNYANPQGLRSTEFNSTANSRRLQTNSLPTFRTPLTDVEKNLPMRTLPCSGRHNNHASAISLLSYYRSKRTLSVSTNDGLEDLEKTLCNQTMSSSDGRNNSLRPASMLYKDKGFIRFRRENDPQQPMEMSDEDDHLQEDVDTSLEDAESTKANVGSSFHSLLEGDVVQNTLSPFFQIGYKRRFRKMSRVSIETTDYSADVSSDQLSNVVNLRNGLSTSALDFNTRKYGSTCSSESAANSFDVTFFLNSNSSPEMQTSPTSTTPASLNVCSAYRSETEDDKTSSVEGHEVMLRSVSPIVKRASSGRLSLNLNLHAAADTSHSSGHVNVACGTEDITPDSAVYLDLQLSRDCPASPKLQTRLFPSSLGVPQGSSPCDSFTKSTDGILPLSLDPASKQQSPSLSPTSQSLGELRTSSSYVLIPRIKKNSKGLLYKLRGSTFSLNAAVYGYEPLEPVEQSKSSFSNKKRLKRSSSDRRPLSEELLEVQPRMTPLGEFRNRTTGTGSGFLGDSGLLGDCGVALVDVASQTDDTEINECPHKTCTFSMQSSSVLDSQSQVSTHLVDVRK